MKTVHDPIGPLATAKNNPSTVPELCQRNGFTLRVDAQLAKKRFSHALRIFLACESDFHADLPSRAFRMAAPVSSEQSERATPGHRQQEYEDSLRTSLPGLICEQVSRSSYQDKIALVRPR